MFEFEMSHGDIDDPKKMGGGGGGSMNYVNTWALKSPIEKTYAEWQKHYGLAEDYEMTAEEETQDARRVWYNPDNRSEMTSFGT